MTAPMKLTWRCYPAPKRFALDCAMRAEDDSDLPWGGPNAVSLCNLKAPGCGWRAPCGVRCPRCVKIVERMEREEKEEMYDQPE
jgi:hypothetical protein